MLDASPCWKSTLTPSCRALSLAIPTNVWLMSSPVTWNRPSRAISIAKYPGPGATSSTLAPSGRPPVSCAACFLHSSIWLPEPRVVPGEPPGPQVVGEGADPLQFSVEHGAHVLLLDQEEPWDDTGGARELGLYTGQFGLQPDDPHLKLAQRVF